MNKWITVGAAAIVVAAGLPASAQEASAEVQKACRDTAAEIARIYMDAKKRGAKDLEKGVYRPSTNWGEQVAHYMAQAASRSETLTESELTSLGATYCIQRRPTETK